MSRAEDPESLCVPFFKSSKNILRVTRDELIRPVKHICEYCKCEEDYAVLWCWGCCWCIAPLFSIYFLFLGFVLLVELVILAIVGIIIGLCYILVGVWPAFILTGKILVISLVQLPFNLYYSLRVAYYTVMIRPGLKIITILLLPPLHLLFPVFTFLIVLVGGLVVSMSVSFAGWPMKPWRKMSPIYNKFYQVYVVDTKRVADNYGHRTGVPEGWDGRVYGIPLDPITVIFGIVITINGLVSVTTGFLVIIAVKSVPMYLWIIKEFAMFASLKKMFKNYRKRIVSLAQYDCVKAYIDWFGGFMDCFPFKSSWFEDTCMLLVLWWLILFCWTTWLVLLPLVILLPPILLLIVWLAVLLLPPVGYLLAWIFVLIAPLILFILAVVVAPFISLKCPYIALRHNILLPGRLMKSLKIGLLEPLEILRGLDKLTSFICLGQWTLFKPTQQLSNIQRAEKWTEGVLKVKYWDLYLDRVNTCKEMVLDRGWLCRDDIECAMPNVTVSLPGLAILDILVESVRREGEQQGVKGLVWWNEDTQCDDSNRDRADNVISHYWPQLNKVKESLRKLNKNNVKKTTGSEESLVRELFYMQAQLCAGDSEQSEELLASLSRDEWDQEQILAMNRVCSQVSDIVYSLLRTDVMQRRFMALLTRQER